MHASRLDLARNEVTWCGVMSGWRVYPLTRVHRRPALRRFTGRPGAGSVPLCSFAYTRCECDGGGDICKAQKISLPEGRNRDGEEPLAKWDHGIVVV
jgi:hypothetical protein